MWSLSETVKGFSWGGGGGCGVLVRLLGAFLGGVGAGCAVLVRLLGAFLGGRWWLWSLSETIRGLSWGEVVVV